MIDLKQLEELIYQVPIKKELNKVDKNPNVISYINQVPYDDNI